METNNDRKLSTLGHAIDLLAASPVPLTAGEIWDAMKGVGTAALVGGKTPHKTLRSRLIEDSRRADGRIEVVPGSRPTRYRLRGQVVFPEGNSAVEERSAAAVPEPVINDAPPDPEPVLSDDAQGLGSGRPDQAAPHAGGADDGTLPSVEPARPANQAASQGAASPASPNGAAVTPEPRATTSGSVRPPTTSNSWPAPPTPLELPPPAKFPAYVLPAWLGEWVRETAEASEVPVDLPAILGLSSVSAASAKSYVVHLRGGWQQPLNLYASIVLPPGERKSGPQATASRPFWELQRELQQGRRAEISKAEALRSIKQTQYRALVRLAARGEATADDVLAAKVELDRLGVPALPRLITDDATPEALHEILAENGERVAVFSDEAGMFEIAAGRYSGRANIELLLRGYDGGAGTRDRVGSPGRPLLAPAITICMTIQPDVLDLLGSTRKFRGRGLLGRFLWAMPEGMVGSRPVAGINPSGRLSDLFQRTIRSIIKIDHRQERMLWLDDDAAARLLEFERALEPRQNAGGDLAEIRDWSSKHVGRVVRVAGSLHVAACFHHGEAPEKKPIGLQTVEYAIDVGDYAVSHALRVFDRLGIGAVGRPAMDDARYILAWALRRGHPCFTLREAHRMNQRRFRLSSDLEPGLRVLVDHGQIRRIPGADPRSGPTYEVHPVRLDTV